MKTSPWKQLLALLINPFRYGVIAALGATFFLKLVEVGQELLYGVIPHSLGFTETPWWLAGIYLLVSAVLILLIRKMPGQAGPGPLTGFHFDTPREFAPAILLTALVSLIAGASLGPEAPLIILGTTLALLTTRSHDEQTRKAAMFISGAAAIGAVFGNPFITAFMILEFAAIGIVPYALILPVMTALAASFIVQTGIWRFKGFEVHPLAVQGIPDYSTIDPGDFLGAVLVAVIAGLIALSTRALGGRVQAFSDKKFAPTLFISVAIIIALVFVGQTFFGIELNQLLFSGNSGMSGLIAESSVFVVIFVLLAKTAIYSLTLGSGFRGGPIFPITFLGVAVGVLVSLHFPGSPVSAFAAAGIAGASAAFLKLPATSALLAAVLIGGAGEAIAPIAITGAVVGFIIRAMADARAPQETPAHS
ncbi:chloride channel protein [Aurantimicrobium minutum]|jgi:H+/Cl- antiporter ClcA|uniref:Putative membrane protein CrgA n=1 Tax=Aurantimicrobium minutum TaxID=708131 RepID=A0A173LXW8_9MICO|nr:chloride channel protein [Aurantimicrobium minutum]BAU99826.1 putative membrane protein CrgA [Aurantimicrobium minutum]